MQPYSASRILTRVHALIHQSRTLHHLPHYLFRTRFLQPLRQCSGTQCTRKRIHGGAPPPCFLAVKRESSPYGERLPTASAQRCWGYLRGVVVAILLFGFSAAATAQQWQTDAVLSQHLIYQMEQDSAGFFWVATDNGVYRYDGYSMVSLNALTRGRVRLPASRYVLAKGLHGDLWVLGTQGLYRYSAPRQQLEAIPVHPITAWAADQLALVADSVQDRLWVAGSDLEIVALSLRRGTVIAADSWPRPLAVAWMAPAGQAGVWVQDANQQLTHLVAGRVPRRYQAGRKYVFPVPATNPQQFVSAFALYTARPDGRLQEVQRWLRPSLAASFTEETIFWPALQPGREQWVVGNQLVRLRRQGGRGQVVGATLETAQFANSQGYGGSVFYRSFVDALGMEWCFSPFLRGCYKRHRTPYIQRLRTAQDQWYSARSIFRLPDQRLLVSSYSAPLVQAPGLPGSPLQPARFPGASEPYVFNDFLLLKSNELLATENKGLYRLSLTTWAMHRIGRSPAPNDTLLLHATDLAQGADGRIWVGALSGLYWLSAAQPWLHAYANEALHRPLRGIMALAFDRDGFLWLATTDGLYRLHAGTGRVQYFALGEKPPHRLPTNELLSLHVKGARAWVGTRDQGLLLVDATRGLQRKVTMASGLPSNTVCSLLSDQAGNLWLGTYAGIVRYQPTTGSLAVYTAADGLADNECNYQSAFRDRDGALYFGSVKGVTRIQPQELSAEFSTRRRLVISRIGRQPDGDTLSHFSYPATRDVNRLRLVDGDQATVQVALTDYLNPGSTRYRYRLQGLADSAWHPLPLLRTVRLAKLPTGDYILQVRSESARGRAAANRLAIPVQVRRTWWKYPSVWAVLGGLLLGSMSLGLWRIRRKSRQQRMQLRRQLAHDLHDELGALLVRASLQAELLQEEVPAAAPAATRLLTDLQAASQAMRDVVWGIDPHANTLGDLVNRMREHLEQTTAPPGRRVELSTQGLQEQLEVGQLLRQNVYAIFKEAVTNSLRHAQQSTFLQVQVNQQHRQLEIIVQDDGLLGSVPSTRRGVGLRSMRQRVATLGGAFEAGALPSRGFKVRVAIPLK